MSKLARNLAISMLATLSPLFFLVPAARATTANTTFRVTATVTGSCSVTANNISFSDYDPLSGTDLKNNGSTIEVTCTKGTQFTVALDAGANAGGSANFNNRAMKGLKNGDFLNYQIYTDSAHTVVWGDGSGSSQTVTKTGAGPATTKKLTMYAEIPAHQNVSAGDYKDSAVTATIIY